MSFRSVFLAVLVAFALILAAFLINRARPKSESEQPTADLVRATGKCAECHSRTQYAVVHEYEMSCHAKKGVNCLDCHQPAAGQEKKDHHGFVISSQTHRRKLPQLPRQYLSAISAQPPRRAVLGRHLRRKRPHSGTGKFLRNLSARRHAPAAASFRPARGRLGHDQRLRAMPQRRQAE